MLRNRDAQLPYKLGFTLIELLIVVAIIGILAAIAVPNFMNARMRSMVAKAYGDIKALAMANEMYALDNNGGYPPESEHNPYERGRMEAGLFWLTSPIPYIASIPEDPFVPATEELRTPRVYETGVFTRRPKNVAYVIFTIGPDGDENGISSASPFVGMQKQGNGNTYAMSNGLRSRGDIYWYGGDCSVTLNLILDGRTYKGTCPPSFKN